MPLKRVSRRAAWLVGFAALVLTLASAWPGAPTGAATAVKGPRVTIRAHWAPRIKLIAFAGDLIAHGSTMVATASFRVFQRHGSTYRPVSVWMALITGEGARWRPNGTYRAALMQMQAPMAPGIYRVELQAVDSDGGVTRVFSAPVRVP